MRSKYGNRKTVIDGIVFDSAREARRYGELKLLQRTGKIRDLELQRKFEISPKSDAGRALYYIADFVYWDCNKGQIVVEDEKGYRTDVYKLKKRLMYDRYGIWIREV